TRIKRVADPAGWGAVRTDSSGLEDGEPVHEAETGGQTKKICCGVGRRRVGDHARGMDPCRAGVSTPEPAVGRLIKARGPGTGSWNWILELDDECRLSVLPVGQWFADAGSFRNRSARLANTI